MTINVEVFGSLTSFTGFKSRKVDVGGGSTVKDVKESIGIPANYSCAILINGIHAKVDEILKDNDSLKLLMIASGG